MVTKKQYLQDTFNNYIKVIKNITNYDSIQSDISILKNTTQMVYVWLLYKYNLKVLKRYARSP